MPLSGAPMTSDNTAAASSSRFAGSLSLASNGAIAKVVTRMNLISHSFQPAGLPRAGLRATIHSLARIAPNVPDDQLQPIMAPSGTMFGEAGECYATTPGQSCAISPNIARPAHGTLQHRASRSRKGAGHQYVPVAGL